MYYYLLPYVPFYHAQMLIALMLLTTYLDELLSWNNKKRNKHVYQSSCLWCIHICMLCRKGNISLMIMNWEFFKDIKKLLVCAIGGCVNLNIDL